MLKIKYKVLDFINKYDMLNGVKKLYIATSGGADSMALLSFMNEYKNEFNIEIGAVHVNHCIRDITADRDENFVRDFCNKKNIEFISFNAKAEGFDVPENASEEWARELRYNFFSRVITNDIKIATAHTLSDQTETVIFRMSRGCGLNGLTGIPAVREGYIRPFLCLTRSEIEYMVNYYGCDNITDESNLTDDYSRNKIRHHIIPVMKDINQEAEVAIGKICDRISAAYNYINKIAHIELDNCCNKKNTWYNIDGFVSQDEVIVDEMISIFLGELGVLNEGYINIIKGFISKYHSTTKEETLGVLQVNDDKSIVVSTKYICVKINNLESLKVKVGVNNFGAFGHGILIEEVSMEEFLNDTKDNKSRLAFYADEAKLNLDDLIICGKNPGDEFKPACKTKNKVVNLMRNKGLVEKDSVPLVKFNNNIIYLWDVGFTDGYTPDKNTEKIYRFVPI